MTKKIILLVVTLLISAIGDAQNVDSLYLDYQEAPRIEVRAKALNLIAIFQSKDYLDAPLSLGESVPNDYLDMVIDFCMATEYYLGGHLLESLDLAKRSYEKVPQDSLVWQFEFLSLMGMDYQLLGQNDLAVNCCQQEMKLHEQLGRKDYLSITLNTLAVLNCRLKLYDEALEYADRAVAIERELGREDRLAVRLGVRSDVLKSLERYDEAIRDIDEAMTLDEKAGRNRKVALRNLIKANIFMVQGKYDDMLQPVTESVQQFKSLGDDYYYATALCHLGSCECHLRKFDKAEKHLNEADTLCEKYGYATIRHSVHEIQHILWASMGNYQKAYEQCRLWSKEGDSLFNIETNKKLLEFQTQYESQEKESQITIEAMKNRRRGMLIILLSVIALALAAMLVIELRLRRIIWKRNEALKQSNENKTRLIGIITHDMRTSVLAQKQVLERIDSNFEKESPADLKDDIHQLKESAESLNNQFGNLVSWVLFCSGNFKLNKVRFKLGKAVEECFKPEMAVAKSKGVKLLNEIDNNVVIFSDLNIVKVVLRNLVSNAIKFSYQDGEVLVRYQDGLLTVEDHGTGMSEEKLRSLFVRNSPSEQGTGGENGLGFGLFVCNELLEKMGTTLQVSSRLGKGTTIGFRLAEESRNQSLSNDKK